MDVSYGTIGALCFVGFVVFTLVTTKNWTKLDTSFVFYASYHFNFINKVIHLCCIWPIYLTLVVVFGCFTDEIIPFVKWGNVSFVITFFIYVPYYLVLTFGDKAKDVRVAGIVGASLATACWYFGNAYADSHPNREDVILF